MKLISRLCLTIQLFEMTILNTLDSWCNHPKSCMSGLAAEKRYTSEICPSDIRVHTQYTCIMHHFSYEKGYVNLVVCSTEKAALDTSQNPEHVS